MISKIKFLFCGLATGMFFLFYFMYSSVSLEPEVSKEEYMKRLAIEQETNLVKLQTLITPQLTCPKLARVGGKYDGGKFVCNPVGASKTCIVYSFGVNGDVQFETDMYKISNGRCKMFSFDPGAQPIDLFTPFNGTYLPYKICKNTNKTASEWSILDVALSLDHDRIEFMKMDIEGGEFDALPPIVDSKWGRDGRICQLFVEFHSYVDLWKDLQRRLEKNGFLMFSKDPNKAYDSCYEYSFIHKNCLNQYGVPHIVSHYNYNQR